MSAPSTPLTGDPLLEAVTDATAEPHQPRCRRVPATGHDRDALRRPSRRAHEHPPRKEA